MAFFARATAWAPLFISIAAVMTALSWGIAWRRHQLRRLTPSLAMLTAMTAEENIKAGRTDKQNIWEVNTEQDYHEQK